MVLAACARGGAGPEPAPRPPAQAVAAARDTAAEARERQMRDSAEAVILVRRGQGHLEGGRDSLAATDFAAALRMAPRLGEAVAGLAVLEWRARRYQAALALADSAVALGDTALFLTNLRGRLLFSLRRCPEAVAVLLPLVRAHPEWRQPTPDLARCLLSLRRPSEAVTVLQEAVRREPTAPPLQFALVDAFTANGQPDSGLAHARYLTAQHPENGLWWVVIGREFVLVNQMDSARVAFERGFRLRPGLVDSLPPIDRSAWDAVRNLPRRPPP